MATPFYTVAQCQEVLTKLHQASLDLADGKTVSVSGTLGGRSITSMGADEIAKMIELWSGHLAAAESGRRRGPRMRLVTFR